MNFVATYDERYDKSPFFGAFEELCRSGIELKKFNQDLIKRIMALGYYLYPNSHACGLSP